MKLNAVKRVTGRYDFAQKMSDWKMDEEKKLSHELRL
jgi:hypothetical protein